MPYRNGGSDAAVTDRACGRKAGRMDLLANQDYGYTTLTLFAPYTNRLSLQLQYLSSFSPFGCSSHG